ncbi:hypothetical protein LPJ66_001498 [Kickxella alabastrina]|uniref:Uncharacterized protein n=1 Tax=Kickxella alabastrina TaxID=61397 RepID=A0ACC1IT18_9FUNG|nr:hypothetical protein LPJ66_001498 [Kickxella alabastrina]
MNVSNQQLSSTPGAAADANAASISIEQLRVAFENGSPTVVYDSLQPYLSLESKSNGGARAINEISESIGKLLYPWFQNSEAMRSDEQRSLYMLLRPDGRLVDALLQYHLLQRQRGSSVYGMVVQVQSLPVEFHSSRSPALPAEFARRVAAAGNNNSDRSAGFNVDALEYYIFHLCKALVPPRENSTDLASGSIAYPSTSAGRKPVSHGAVVSGSAVSCLAREYTCFFLPVSVPEKQLNAHNESGGDANPMNQIRSRLSDFSPNRTQANQQGDMGDARKPGTTDVDLLDTCEYAQALDLATYFASCATLLWLPVITRDLRASIRSVAQKEAGGLLAANDPTGDASGWVWIPSFSHLSALNLFHMLVGHLAKGERQMERYHLTGALPQTASATGQSGPVNPLGSDNVSAQYIEAYDKRVGMSGTIRDTLRSRLLTVSVADTLGLMLACCSRAGIADTDIWIPFLDVTASIWIRYIMPWRSSRTDSPSNTAADALSPVWQSRIPLMMKGMSPVLYGQAFALFLRQISSPNVDLLAHTAQTLGEQPGHGVQSWINGAVGSVFGHGHNMDALTVVERVVSAFTSTELRAILAAVERLQLDAFPHLRSQMGVDPLTVVPTLDPTIENGMMATPTKAPSARPPQQQLQQQTKGQKDGAFFEYLVATAQQHLAPYASESLSFRSGSQVLDTVVLGALGNPPICIVFGRPPAPLLQTVVHALHGAELLAERQLRLIVPEGSSDQARSLVSDIFLVISRVFSATDSDPGARPWASGGSSIGDVSGRLGGASETMRARAQALHEAQGRIASLYKRLAAVFYVSRQIIEEIKVSQDDTLFSLGMSTGKSNGFGQRLAARSNPSEWAGSGGVSSPDMEHGALTPRGRWELKTGRKKFTTQSLLASPRGSGTPTGDSARRSMLGSSLQMQSPPPRWNVRESSAEVGADFETDAALLPRGPRALYVARSYENQWLLDRTLWLDVVANDCFQKLLDLFESMSYPIPLSLRAYKLNFRWLAAYQNIRFFAVLLLAVWLFRFLFF